MSDQKTESPLYTYLLKKSKVDYPTIHPDLLAGNSIVIKPRITDLDDYTRSMKTVEQEVAAANKRFRTAAVARDHWRNMHGVYEAFADLWESEKLKGLSREEKEKWLNGDFTPTERETSRIPAIPVPQRVRTLECEFTFEPEIPTVKDDQGRTRHAVTLLEEDSDGFGVEFPNIRDTVRGL